MARKVPQFKKKHINKYWNEPFSAALASRRRRSEVGPAHIYARGPELGDPQGDPGRPPPPLAVLQSEDLMDGVRFKPGRGGEGEERTGGKQKPDFLSGLERPSRADAERCPLTAAKNSSPPPLMEKASTERQQEDGGKEKEKEKQRKSVSARLPSTISCNYVHFSASRSVVPLYGDTPKETPRAGGFGG